MTILLYPGLLRTQLLRLLDIKLEKMAKQITKDGKEENIPEESLNLVNVSSIVDSVQKAQINLMKDGKKEFG